MPQILPVCLLFAASLVVSSGCGSKETPPTKKPPTKPFPGMPKPK
jgi:hypothetical protein